MLALDLEHYDYNKGSSSLIRATEGTILDRLPPVCAPRGATLELPHILVLIDDPQRTVIEPLIAMREQMQPLYDFDLMLAAVTCGRPAHRRGRPGACDCRAGSPGATRAL
jgi:hypothetical protein